MLPWLAASACTPDPPAPDPTGADDPGGTGDTGGPDAPATPSPRVLAVGPVAAGLDIRVTVRPMLPGEVLVAGWSSAGPGDGPCPPSLRGACFGITGAVVLPPVTADYAGAATAVVRIDRAPPGPVWVQAFVVPPAGDAVATDVLERPVLAPAEVWVGDAAPTDLDGFRAVTGDLRLEGSDLAGFALPDLEHVGGSVVLWEDPALARASLPALRWVSGDLSLYDAPRLARIEVPVLDRVGGTLAVHRMPAVADLDAFAALEVIGGDLYVYHDLALARIDGMPALARIGGGAMLWELPALHTVALPGLRGIGSKLDLFENDALTTLSLPALADLGAYELHHCDAMADVGRFDALGAVRGEVALRYDAGLTSLSGFAGVTRMGALSVSFSDRLGRLAGLEELAELTLGLELVRLPSLTAVDLPRLARAAAVSVQGNAALADPGLAALTEVHSLGFVDNPVLPGCAVEALIARTSPSAVTCAGNLADGCTTWCGEAP